MRTEIHSILQAHVCTPGAAVVPCVSRTLPAATKAVVFKSLCMCACVREACEGLWS